MTLNIFLNRTQESRKKLIKSILILFLGIFLFFFETIFGSIETPLSNLFSGHFTYIISSLSLMLPLMGVGFFIAGIADFVAEITKKNENENTSKKSSKIFYWVWFIIGAILILFFVVVYQTISGQGEFSGFGLIGPLYLLLTFGLTTITLVILSNARKSIEIAREAKKEGKPYPLSFYIYLGIFLCLLAFFAPFFL